MNWDKIEGQWKQLKGRVRQRWAKFTDDDLAKVEGKREELVGRIQERYGVVRDEAEKQADEWANTLESDKDRRGSTNR